MSLKFSSHCLHSVAGAQRRPSMGCLSPRIRHVSAFAKQGLPKLSQRSLVAKQSLLRSVLAGDKGAVSDEDRQYIRQALDLARRGLGKTAPNPAVGCVIVKDGQVIGEGFHPKAGEPHAEVFALRAAGQEAAGATAYVTLEPCNHYGKTPPCSQALVAGNVARVVVGVRDPNVLVRGKGIASLEQAGIEVAMVGGEEQEQCYQINEEFMKQMESVAA